MPLRGLSRRFSYSHLLFSPTLALPVDGVGVPGPLDELSPNRLLLKGLPPPWLSRFVAEPPLLLLEKEELDVDRPRLGRGLPELSIRVGRSPWLLKLLRGVDLW